MTEQTRNALAELTAALLGMAQHHVWHWTDRDHEDWQAIETAAGRLVDALRPASPGEESPQ